MQLLRQRRVRQLRTPIEVVQLALRPTSTTRERSQRDKLRHLWILWLTSSSQKLLTIWRHQRESHRARTPTITLQRKMLARITSHRSWSTQKTCHKSRSCHVITIRPRTSAVWSVSHARARARTLRQQGLPRLHLELKSTTTRTRQARGNSVPWTVKSLPIQTRFVKAKS